MADSLALQRGWHAITLPSGAFKLRAYFPDKPVVSDTLSIYIEGDGLAWISATRPSSDPTPLNPLALKLALRQPSGAAAYLARPCQYVDAELDRCSRRYWTDHRFAPEVIAASSQAINVLKRRFGASKLVLVGYSGGGAVATLVAARRLDVSHVVTVAGNLDHRAWTSLHKLEPLAGSLNPADEVNELDQISQTHFAGGKDQTITPMLIRSFSDRFPENLRPLVLLEPEFDHQCCWVENWPSLWRTIPAAK